MNVLSSRIEAVTVYREGALIRRVARLEGDPDGMPSRVRLFNLPLTLDERSLRVKVLPGGSDESPRALPVAVDVKIGLAVGPPDPEAKPAQDAELRAAIRHVRSCETVLERLRAERDRLLSLAPARRPKPEKGGEPRPSPVNGRLALLTFREEEASRLHREIASATEALRLANEAHAKLEAKAAEATLALQARAEQLQKTVEIGLKMPEGAAAETAPSITLALEYLVPGARWSPAYTLELDPKLDAGRLAVRAAIRQATGEDWSGVALTLSTAEAMRWTELPELKAIRIGRKQGLPLRRGFRPPPEGAGALYLDHDQGFGSPSSASAVAEPEALYGSIGAAVGERAGGQGARIDDELRLEESAEVFPEEAWEEDYMECSGEEDFEAEIDQPAPAPVSSARASSGPPAMASRTMAPPSPSRSRMRKARSAPRGRAMVKKLAEAPPEADTSIQASDAHLDFGALRLRGPQDPDRGRLIAISRTEITMQLFQTLSLEVPELSAQPSQITQAQQRAASVAALPFPEGHCEPEPKGGFDYAYEAKLPADVPSDGALHTLLLQEAKGEVNALHVCVPRESQEVFREVRFKNPLDAPLLEGPVDVQIGEDYLLTSQTRNTPAHGALTLGLGVEQAIKVARNVHFEEESTGLVRGRLGLEHRIEVEIQNHLDREAEIEVRERLPVSVENDDDVEVEELESTPAWKAYQPERGSLKGGRCWRLTLAPAEKKILKAGYLIRIPKGHALRGGNRREVS